MEDKINTKLNFLLFLVIIAIIIGISNYFTLQDLQKQTQFDYTYQPDNTIWKIDTKSQIGCIVNLDTNKSWSAGELVTQDFSNCLYEPNLNQ